MQERMKLLGTLSTRAGIKEKSDRLTALVLELPASQDAYERARANLAAQERLLGEREDILVASGEGKNAEARKASLLIAKQSDRDWQQLLVIVNTVRAQVLDAALVQERLKREWMALTIQIHIFTATLGFLAGASDRNERTEKQEGEQP